MQIFSYRKQFSWNVKACFQRKNILNLLAAEFALRVVKINILSLSNLTDQPCLLQITFLKQLSVYL